VNRLWIIRYIRLILSRRAWRKSWREKNSHNTVETCNSFDINLVDIGRYTYGKITVLAEGDLAKLTIGSFCSLGTGTTFMLNAEHNMECISTFPFKVKVFGDRVVEAETKGNIVLKDDVWIGENAMIMSGVTISQGAVVGAESVVTKDVPPYAIVAGNPARVIRYRFSDDVIEKLLKIDYSKLELDFIMSHKEEFYKPINSIEDIKWIYGLEAGETNG